MATTQPSLSHQAYLALEHLLVTRQLAPGAVVTEKQLIEMAGHGRTPVREAIQRLAWQGLIAVRARVGLQITHIREQDQRHILQVRRELEPLVAALAAEHATDAQRAALIDCAQTMTASAATSDLAGFFVADRRFDGILQDACPNAFLTQALAPLQTHARRISFAQISVERMDRAITLHVGVIRAVQQGDPAAARKAMLALVDANGKV